MYLSLFFVIIMAHNLWPLGSSGNNPFISGPQILGQCAGQNNRSLANNEHVGDSTCRDDADHSAACPKYADNACASTSAIHRLAGELVYEVHKSCSPFNFGNELDCFGLDMNQGDEKVHFDVCKVMIPSSNLTKSKLF